MTKCQIRITKPSFGRDDYQAHVYLDDLLFMSSIDFESRDELRKTFHELAATLGAGKFSVHDPESPRFNKEQKMEDRPDGEK